MVNQNNEGLYHDSKELVEGILSQFNTKLEEKGRQM